MRNVPNVKALLQHTLVVDGNDSDLAIVQMEGKGADLGVHNANMPNLYGSANAVESVSVSARLDFARGGIVGQQCELVLLEVKEQRVLLVALCTRPALSAI